MTSTLSPRRAAPAAGLLVAVIAAAIAAAMLTGRQPHADEPDTGQPPVAPAGQRQADPPQPTASPSSSPSRSPSPSPSPTPVRAVASPSQHRRDAEPVGRQAVAAARERAEAFAVAYLTWRYDEPVAKRQQRLEAHMTDRFASQHTGRLGHAERQRRRDAHWRSSAAVTHSYPETITGQRIVIVVIATKTITTAESTQQRDVVRTLEVVPTSDGWRVDQVVV
jgi:hypothetical protein